MANGQPIDASRSARLHKKALQLEWFTVLYNVIEGVVSIIVGLMSGSIALVGFGTDSAVESLSGCILIWRLSYHGSVTPEHEERIEKTAVRLVGASLLVLGAYVLFASAKKLYLFEHPDPSIPGIFIALLSIIIMPTLARAKKKTAREMGSRSLEADSTQTYICAYLSVALLVGLGLNYLFGLWWADPAAALVIVALIFKEATEMLKKEKACSC